MLFGDSKLFFENGQIQKCKLHGICARGGSSTIIKHSKVRNSGVRGMYAYHSASLDLNNVIVSETKNSRASAIQIEALRPGDHARLRVLHCHLENNLGRGLSIAGTVTCDIDSSVSIDSDIPAATQLNIS